MLVESLNSRKALTKYLEMVGIEVYDNGGISFDRYTVIIGGSVFAMSSRPLNPNEFNSYVGEISELNFVSNITKSVLKILPAKVLYFLFLIFN